MHAVPLQRCACFAFGTAHQGAQACREHSPPRSPLTPMKKSMAADLRVQGYQAAFNPAARRQWRGGGNTTRGSVICPNSTTC